MLRNCLYVIVFALVIVSLVSPEPAETIPAFARKYSFSCSTCHIAAPKLKEYGDEFAGNGFQLPDADEPVRAFKDVGDDNLLLHRELPIAVRFDAFTLVKSKGDIKSDLETPYGLKLLSGGNIAKDIGYYFYFYMDERGEVSGVEDAYVHFNNIKGTELDIMVGQFQISDPLFKRELRLTYEDYQIYKTKVGDSAVNLTYDRGIIATYSLPTKTDLVVEIVNGSGIGDAGADRLFDTDNPKNVFVKVSQDCSLFTLGMFGYFGEEKGTGADNKFSMLGPDISFGTDIIELNAQYVRRVDDNPEFKAGKIPDYTTEGYIGELVINPFPKQSRLFGVILYNKVTSDFGGLEYETITGSVSYLYKTNLRFLAELIQDTENEETKFLVGLMSGF